MFFHKIVIFSLQFILINTLGPLAVTAFRRWTAQYAPTERFGYQWAQISKLWFTTEIGWALMCFRKASGLVRGTGNRDIKPSVAAAFEEGQDIEEDISSYFPESEKKARNYIPPAGPDNDSLPKKGVDIEDGGDGENSETDGEDDADGEDEDEDGDEDENDQPIPEVYDTTYDDAVMDAFDIPDEF